MVHGKTEAPLVMKNMLHIFRQDMRLHDSDALYAIQQQLKANRKEGLRSKVGFLYISDDEYLNQTCHLRGNRHIFNSQCLDDVYQQLKQLNVHLHMCLVANPKDMIAALSDIVTVNNIDTITFTRNPEDRWRGFEHTLHKFASSSQNDVRVKVYTSNVYHFQEKISSNGGVLPLSIDKFLQAGLSDPKTINPCKPKFDLAIYPQEHLEPAGTRLEPWNKKRYLARHNFKSEALAPEFVGGELRALALANKMIENAISFQPLCAYEACGALSCRWILHEMHKRVLKIIGSSMWTELMQKFSTQVEYKEQSEDTVTLSILMQQKYVSVVFWKGVERRTKEMYYRLTFYTQYIPKLLWREFFVCMSTYVKNYHQQGGNAACKQLSWCMSDECIYFNRKVTAWQNGRTGFPYIDAVLRKLKLTGNIEQHERLAIANYLTVSQLRISWEIGQEHFEKYLIDSDYSLNAGNWMWASRVAYRSSSSLKDTQELDSTYYSKRYDQSGHFIRMWCPELEGYTTEELHEPWRYFEEEVVANYAADCSKDEMALRCGVDALNSSMSQLENEEYNKRLNARIFLFAPSCQYSYSKDWAEKTESRIDYFINRNVGTDGCDSVEPDYSYFDDSVQTTNVGRLSKRNNPGLITHYVELDLDNDKSFKNDYVERYVNCMREQRYFPDTFHS